MVDLTTWKPFVVKLVPDKPLPKDRACALIINHVIYCQQSIIFYQIFNLNKMEHYSSFNFRFHVQNLNRIKQHFPVFKKNITMNNTSMWNWSFSKIMDISRR